MEQIIILIIMLALGSLFGKKKEKPEPKQRPERQPRPATMQRPVEREPARPAASKSRTLKDLSRELFENIQEEFQELQQEMQDPEKPKDPQKKQNPQSEIFYPETPVEKQRQKQMEQPKPAFSRPERQSRKREHQSDRTSAIMTDEPILQEDFVPRTQQQVLQGIVYSEILGPPKSKR